MYLDRVKEKFYSLYAKKEENKVIPCSDREVEELESWVGAVLPAAYREFLFWMGHSGADFLQGSDCFYQDLKNIQSWARELLEEDHFPGILPEDSFIFYMHQGYDFHFFLLQEGEDPPVYNYYEEEPVRTAFVQIYTHFSDFLMAEMEAYIQIKIQKSVNCKEKL